MKKKTETKVEQPAVEKPFVLMEGPPPAVAGGPVPLRGVTTDQIEKPVASEVEPNFGPRGPQVADFRGGQPVGEWLQSNATEAELKMFRAAVLARKAKGGESLKRILPGGRRIQASAILVGCQNCGSWFWANKLGGPCMYCPAGRLRVATAEETAAWFKREEKAIEDCRRASFNQNNVARQAGGLDPLTREQFLEEQQKEAEHMRQREAQLGRVAAAYRRPE